MWTLDKLLKNERGATAVEYALIAALISVAAVTAFANLGDEVDNSFTEIDQAMTNSL